MSVTMAIGSRGGDILVQRSTESSPVGVYAKRADTGELVEIFLPLNCLLVIPREGESVAEQLARVAAGGTPW